MIGQSVQAAFEMQRDSAPGDTHAHGDFLAGQSFDTRQFDGFALAGRQLVEGIAQPKQFLTGRNSAIRGEELGFDRDTFEIGGGIDGNDAGLPGKIDEVIACGSEQKIFGGLRRFKARRAINADVNLMTDVLQLAPLQPIPAKVLHQQRLQGQDLAHKPSVHLGDGHFRAGVTQVSGVTTRIQDIDHSSRLPPLEGHLFQPMPGKTK